MTDKQIIIDGIDVSGCEFYKNTLWKNCYSRDYEESVCQSNHNCYYKNLKRQERKCDMWENIAVENGAVALKYQQQIDQLKAENDELKNKIFRYEELLKHSAMAQNTYTAEEVNIIASGINFVGKSLIVEENIKLHKTLTEIKEIMKKHCRKCKKHKFYHFQLCCTCKYTDILQKISECEGNDGN